MRYILLLVLLIMGCAPEIHSDLPRCNIAWMENYLQKCMKDCNPSVMDCDGTCVDVARKKYCN
jgi:hypothetical protein|tara:strand:+ start:583 stop:771 length:189 start_codon:yes stop_codon:yes gene_type:complete